MELKNFANYSVVINITHQFFVVVCFTCVVKPRLTYESPCHRRTWSATRYSLSASNRQNLMHIYLLYYRNQQLAGRVLGPHSCTSIDENMCIFIACGISFHCDKFIADFCFAFSLLQQRKLCVTNYSQMNAVN